MKNMLLTIVCFLIFVFAKFWFREAHNSDLLFLLSPTNWGVELFLGTRSVFTADLGYLFADLNIAIEKSCSGFNFLVISWLMACYTMISSEELRSKVNVWLMIPIALILAYLATLLANISRITIYTVLMRQRITTLLDPNDTWLHLAEGVLVYFSFLLLFYFLLNRLITKLKQK